MDSADDLRAPTGKPGVLPKDNVIVINLSGRGDKDVVEVARILNRKID